MSGQFTHTANGAAARRERLAHATCAQIRLIGAACGRGAKDTRCTAGPECLQHGKIVRTLRSRGIDAGWQSIIHANKKRPVQPACHHWHGQQTGQHG